MIVKFDFEKAGIEQRKSFATISEKYKESNGTPIFRQKLRYFLNSANGKAHAIEATVLQFPLKVAFAITGHKMQVSFKKKNLEVLVYCFFVQIYTVKNLKPLISQLVLYYREFDLQNQPNYRVVVVESV